MNERKNISLPLLALLVVAALAALYATAVHRAEVESSITLAARAERDLGEAIRISERISVLRSSFSKRAETSEKMLISFIEETATRNRISLASITIDPGTLKEASRISKFYKEVDTVIRIKQVPLKNIILFLAEMQSRDPNLKPRELSLMPSETDPNSWDARGIISYFVFDEEKEAPAAAVEEPQ